MRILKQKDKIIPVTVGDRSYDIVLSPGVLAEVAEKIRAITIGPKIAVVTDRHVGRYYLQGTLCSLRKAGYDPISIVLSPGEQTKTLRTVENILNTLVRHKFERQSLMLALGGGVIGDITGFTAAIYQRGIPYVQVPTTLVAQVDSSVGGKTGVDHPLGKNLIGAFHQPKVVLIDPRVLRTLPHREWIAGLSEVIKYGIIADKNFFSYLEDNIVSLQKMNDSAVFHMIKRSCEIKAQVVAADERELGSRRILNYGHTIGHALESLAGYCGLIHGEAVGIGLVQEADLACHMGLCGRDIVERIKNLVFRAGLPQRGLPRSVKSIWRAMQHDKKVVRGQVVGVWPVRIGQVQIQPIEERIFAEWFQVKRADREELSSKCRLGGEAVSRKSRERK